MTLACFIRQYDYVLARMSAKGLVRKEKSSAQVQYARKEGEKVVGRFDYSKLVKCIIFEHDRSYFRRRYREDRPRRTAKVQRHGGRSGSMVIVARSN